MDLPTLLILAVALPLVAAVAGLLAPRRLAEVLCYPASLATVVVAVLIALAVSQGQAPRVNVWTLTPGLDLALAGDALGVTFALLASGLWVVATVYSSGYVRAENLHHRPRFFMFFAASIGAAMGVALAANLLTFLLFYELLTLTTWPLVAHKQTPEAIAGGRRYLVFALSAGVALTAAVVATWQITGTLDFVPGGFLAGRVSPAGMAALFALFLLGCGVKAAVFPLHSWLPAAMVAPTPVSALLHAVAVVKAGVFGCIRIVAFVFGPDALRDTWAIHVLAAACAVTIVFGSLMAIRQDHLKRRLAYSTVVQLSYVVLGAALLAPYALAGAVLHMVNHGLAKITLFFCAGAIHAAQHVENVSQLKGLGRRMPWTFAAFTVASLGLIGLPGLCGFVGKFYLARGAVESNQLGYLALLLSGSILSAAYLLPIIRDACFGRADTTGDAAHGHGEATPTMVVPILMTTALVVVFGIVPAALAFQYALASKVAAQVFGVIP